jgi:hypothetical protein
VAQSAVRARTLAWMGLCWLALDFVWPVDWPLDPRIVSALNLAPMAVTLALLLLAVRWDIGSASSRGTEEHPAPSLAAG